MIIETEKGLALVNCFYFYNLKLRSGDFFKSVNDYISFLTDSPATQKQIDIVLREVEYKRVIAIQKF